MFVVSQINGTWHPTIEVPGTAALNRGRGRLCRFGVLRLGGQLQRGREYTDSSGRQQVFVDSEA